MLGLMFGARSTLLDATASGNSVSGQGSGEPPSPSQEVERCDSLLASTLRAGSRARARSASVGRGSRSSKSDVSIGSVTGASGSPADQPSETAPAAGMAVAASEVAAGTGGAVGYSSPQSHKRKQWGSIDFHSVPAPRFLSEVTPKVRWLRCLPV